MSTLPWIHTLPVPDMETAFKRLAIRPNCLFLDSARRDASLGRYSFLSADPFEMIQLWDAGERERTNPMRSLEARLSQFSTRTVEGLPPFQGGAAGLLGYEFGQAYERIPAARCDEFQTPPFAMGIYDVVLAVDHLTDSAWVISQGFPETDPVARAARAESRGRQFLDWLQTPVDEHRSKESKESTTGKAAVGPGISARDLAEQYAVPGVDGLTSDFSAEQYQSMVAAAVEYIHAGDIFQVNLSQRFLFETQDDSVALYQRLRQRNAGTFAAYFDMGEFQVLSASPERFVSVRGKRVETRPIKGTRPRSILPEADLFSATELSESEKDRAENVMIVDLLRNDLSRVCDPNSVVVTQLCALEQYEFVQHLVSAVEGNLAKDKTPVDLIEAAFPGGSITGAPKVRAMEIIAELEPTARGPYCGSLGYLGFDGAMDLNILIRTITAGRGWWQFPAGGGIVADSSPAAEYRESIDKARGMVRSLLPSD